MLLLLAACNGDEEEEAAPTVPAAAEETQEAADTPAAAEETQEAADTPAPAETETAAGGMFYDLESFHYAIDMEFSLEGTDEAVEFAIASDGDYVAPDRHAWSISTDIGPITLDEAAVVIGDSAWYREGTEWRETTLDDPDIQDALDFSALDPEFFPDLEDLKSLRAEEETLDGLDVLHYQVSEEAVDFIKSFMEVEDLEGIEQFTMEFWLAADGGWPVRIIFEGSATAEAMEMEAPGIPEGSMVDFSASFDLTQVNDPSVTVEPPI